MLSRMFAAAVFALLAVTTPARAATLQHWELVNVTGNNGQLTFSGFFDYGSTPFNYDITVNGITPEGAVFNNANLFFPLSGFGLASSNDAHFATGASEALPGAQCTAPPSQTAPQTPEAQPSDPPFTDRSHATIARDPPQEHSANLLYLDRDTG